MTDAAKGARRRKVLGVWLVGRTGFEDYLPDDVPRSQSRVSTIIVRCESEATAAAMARHALAERIGTENLPDDEWFDFVIKIAEGPAEEGVFFYVGL
jgi:hypothetical protein